ncbi:MAG TPA: low specificity L-threonine aldolase [Alphaproteobacteria bacterium]|nr:low specificity L-threonine aldolase [Alphaproteobacteria bacterium]HAJ46930.1 low specificity L-threonine aldolase [Alphaproteobacteria bacterium]
MHFASDNTTGAAPEVWAALAQANAGNAPSYGADHWTQSAQAKMRALFERDVAVFPVVSGVAANCLAISAYCGRTSSVFAHDEAHILVHEATAPEFYTGARFVPVPGQHGKIDPRALADALARSGRGDLHCPQAAVLSLTQATEVGTVYHPAEIAELSRIAHDAGMRVHMDGARFVNAVAALGCSPAEVTWRAGVDVLSFGLTKNGALAAEAVVFFDPGHAAEFAFLRKRAGHLVSKMRFVSAQIDAMLEDGLWLRLAQHANRAALRLADGLASIKGVHFDIPVQSNSIFPIMDGGLCAALQEKGAHFYPWGGPQPDGAQRVRLVTSFLTSDQDIERFVTLARTLSGA